MLTFVLPWCLSVAAEMRLLDEPLDGVALLGVGRKLEELDILGVTLTMIKARHNYMNKLRNAQTIVYLHTHSKIYPMLCMFWLHSFRFATSSSMIKAHLNGSIAFFCFAFSKNLIPFSSKDRSVSSRISSKRSLHLSALLIINMRRPLWFSMTAR